MQEYLTLLLVSPAPVHNYLFKGYGLCRRVLVCMTSSRTTELKETETPWNRLWRSRTSVWLSLSCTALLIAMQMLQDIGGGLVCLVPALSLGRKEITPVYMEHEERIGCCEEKLTD